MLNASAPVAVTVPSKIKSARKLNADEGKFLTPDPFNLSV